jgi:hypothetical protein
MAVSCESWTAMVRPCHRISTSMSPEHVSSDARPRTSERRQIRPFAAARLLWKAVHFAWKGKWIHAAYALVLKADRGQFTTRKLYTSGEPILPGRGKSLLSLDSYLPWMSRKLCRPGNFRPGNSRKLSNSGNSNSELCVPETLSLSVIRGERHQRSAPAASSAHSRSTADAGDKGYPRQLLSQRGSKRSRKARHSLLTTAWRIPPWLS